MKCRVCGSVMPVPSAFDVNGYGMCDSCKQSAEDKLSAFIATLTDEEVEYLDEIIEGCSLTDFSR